MTKRGDTPEQAMRIAVYAADDADGSELDLLQTQFAVSVRKKMPEVARDALILWLDGEGLALVGDGRMVRGDFAKMLLRIAPDKLHRELVVRAAKIKGVQEGLSAVDATAGLGEDAFLLAAAGFSVRLYERDPVIATLLRDALFRASAICDLAPIVARMELFQADSMTALPQLASAPDVVLLDPMFPTRRKSALVKKKFQLLQQLERPCSDEQELLDAALATGPRKVVVKRPAKGPYLAARKPDYSLKGTSIRYDCIVVPRRGEGSALAIHPVA